METCGVAYQGGFTPLDPNFFYIIEKKHPKLIIFEDPKLPVGNLDPMYKTLLMDLLLPSDKWRSIFVVESTER
jgi:hypothetical protein